MFQRRLLLVAAAMVLVLLGLLTRLSALTLIQGQRLRHKAESVLVQRRLVPTLRGGVLDARGRVVARDKPSYDVLVAYPVISGEWVLTQARRMAYRQDPRKWSQLGEDDRRLLVEQYRPVYQAQEDALWDELARVGGIDPGELLRRRSVVRARVQRIVSSVWLRRQEERSRELGESVELFDVSRPVAEQSAPHALLFDVSDEARARLEGLIARAAAEPLRDDEGRRVVRPREVWTRVSVDRSRRRDYPLAVMTKTIDLSTFPAPLRASTAREVTVRGVGLHVIGRLRPVWEEDLSPITGRPFRVETEDGERIDLGGYLDGDAIGMSGVEAAMESVLRGTRGERVLALDTGEQSQRQPVPGRDVRLSVDVDLQARIQALMDPSLGLMVSQPWHAAPPPQRVGQPLCGAAVVLEVATGRVLAAVSVPWFEIDDTGRAVTEDHPIDLPYLNRVVARPYQPGSTVKPMILAAALTDGLIGRHEAVECNGMFDPRHPNMLRCWIYNHYHATHGPLEGPEAIARSCNIYFYTLGDRLGWDRIVRWYDRFGLGRSTGCGLPEEVGGDLPRLPLTAGPDGTRRPSLSGDRQRAVLMGIGQGPVRWTPIQAASAYATLARGGVVVRPTVIDDDADSDRRVRGRAVGSLGLDPIGVEMALRGLEEAAGQTYGTANQIRLPDGTRERIFSDDLHDWGVTVRAKSGTADEAGLRIDANRDGRITRDDPIVREGDQAWCVALVTRRGTNRPANVAADFVVLVVAEHAGSGGAVSGPILNQILLALRTEGYL